MEDILHNINYAKLGVSGNAAKYGQTGFGVKYGFPIFVTETLLLVDRYFSRIQYHPGTERDLLVLAQLQSAHMRAVPFENLDIQHRIELVLQETALFDKIVERHRGGICYELNGSFAALLRELGYQVTLVSAQVCLGDGKLTPDFDHMALLVDIDHQPYLVDVGFGDPSSFLAPLALAERGVQHAAGGRYQLTQDGEHYTVAKLSIVDGTQVTKPMYRFNTTPRALSDFAPQSRFHQESMEAPFRRKVFCSIANTDGRSTIHGDELTVIRGDVSTVTQLAGPEEIDRTIEKYFALKL